MMTNLILDILHCPNTNKCWENVKTCAHRLSIDHWAIFGDKWNNLERSTVNFSWLFGKKSRCQIYIWFWLIIEKKVELISVMVGNNSLKWSRVSVESRYWWWVMGLWLRPSNKATVKPMEDIIVKLNEISRKLLICVIDVRGQFILNLFHWARPLIRVFIRTF